MDTHWIERVGIEHWPKSTILKEIWQLPSMRVIYNGKRYDLYISYKKYLKIMFNKRHKKISDKVTILALILNSYKIKTTYHLLDMFILDKNYCWSSFIYYKKRNYKPKF